jgi:hypothetical protein
MSTSQTTGLWCWLVKISLTDDKLIKHVRYDSLMFDFTDHVSNQTLDSLNIKPVFEWLQET